MSRLQTESGTKNTWMHRAVRIKCYRSEKREFLVTLPPFFGKHWVCISVFYEDVFVPLCFNHKLNFQHFMAYILVWLLQTGCNYMVPKCKTKTNKSQTSFFGREEGGHVKCFQRVLLVRLCMWAGLCLHGWRFLRDLKQGTNVLEKLWKSLPGRKVYVTVSSVSFQVANRCFDLDVFLGLRFSFCRIDC